MSPGDTKTGFMCSVDYRHELSDASDGARIYPTLEDMKEHCSCWKGCGIVEVEVKLKSVVHEGVS